MMRPTEPIDDVDLSQFHGRLSQVVGQRITAQTIRHVTSSSIQDNFPSDCSMCQASFAE